MTSPRGRCHTIDNRADGYTRGEACGVVTLHSQNDRRSLAVLGCALGQDGRSASLTAPNGLAQQRLVDAAVTDACVSIASITIIEAHGTGTALGDPIELGSLVARRLAVRNARMAIGGVKANIGHAEPAAGMTGLLNLSLSLKHHEVMPNAQLRLLNKNLDSVNATTCSLPAHISSLSTAFLDGGVSSFGFSGAIGHAIMRKKTSPLFSGLVVRGHVPGYVTYRRRAMPWLVPVGLASPEVNCSTLQATGTSSPSCEQMIVFYGTSHLSAHHYADLVHVTFTQQDQVALIELNDTTHFNALASLMSGDLGVALEHICRRSSLRGCVLQSSGPHFCIGGNPHEKHANLPLSTMSASVHKIALEACNLRRFKGPISSAVHGHVVGGGLALCLNTTFVIADASATFEHGNLPRGVCPIGEFSQTLIKRIGANCSSDLYLINKTLTSSEALQIRLVNEVQNGCHASRARARALVNTCMHLHVNALNEGIANAMLVAQEVVQHVECRLMNRGESKSAAEPFSEKIFHPIHLRIPSDTCILTPRNHLLIHQVQNNVAKDHASPAALLVIQAFLQASKWPTTTICYDGNELSGTNNLHGKDHRALLLMIASFNLHRRGGYSSFGNQDTEASWIKLASAYMPMTLLPEHVSRYGPTVPFANFVTQRMSSQVCPQFDVKTGVALVTVDQNLVAECLTGSVRLLSHVSPMLRAIVVLINNGRFSPHLNASYRASEEVLRVLEFWRSLRVPMVSCALAHVEGLGHTTWLVGDYRITQGSYSECPITDLHSGISSRVIAGATDAKESALHFALLLTEQSSTGLAHMLELTRPKTRANFMFHASILSVLHMLYPQGTVCESVVMHNVYSLSRVASTSSDSHHSTEPHHFFRCYSNLRTHAQPRLPMLHKPLPKDFNLRAGIEAFEIYLPRYCAGTPALETHQGLPSNTTRRVNERCTSCGEDENHVSMAQTAMHRLMSQCLLSPCHIGKLQVSSQSLIDRSKSTKSVMMLLCEAEGCADVEGADVYQTDSTSTGTSPLLSAFDWMQNSTWDGRFAVVIVTDDLASASCALALLVGPSASLQQRPAGTLRRNLICQTQGGHLISQNLQNSMGHDILALPRNRAHRSDQSSLWCSIDGPDSKQPQLVSLFERKFAALFWLPAQVGVELSHVCITHMLAARGLFRGHNVKIIRARTDLDPNTYLSLCSRKYNMRGVYRSTIKKLLDKQDGAFCLAEMAQPKPNGSAAQTYTFCGGLHLLLSPNIVSYTEEASSKSDTDFNPNVLAFLSTCTDSQILKTTSRREPDAIHSVAKISDVLHNVCEDLTPGASRDAPLMDAGLDSLGVTEFRNRLMSDIDDAPELPETLVFDYPTIRQMEAYIIAELHLDELEPEDAQLCPLPISPACGVEVTELEMVNLCITSQSHRLPGERFASLLNTAITHSIDLVTEVPTSRWLLEPSLSSCTVAINPRVRHGGFMRTCQLFDSQCFAVFPAEASVMDPQQRLLLEESYAALRASGFQRALLLSACIGVGVGITLTEFGLIINSSPSSSSPYASTGASLAIASGRLSFALGLHGPCAAYETACSSTLVAGHAAFSALKRRECISHVAAGVNMMVLPMASNALAAAGMTSLLGRCHTFDRRADGFVRGEGCGAVVVQVDGQHMTLPGSAVRQDGRSASLTAPNGQAQFALIQAALGEALHQPSSLALAEAHGTGTALGDPIETSSFERVLRGRPTTCSPAVTGGLKANSGHGEAAAGILGFVKIVFALQWRLAANNEQLRLLNTHISSSMRLTPSVLPTQACSICASLALAGVSSFGYSGTIAHMSVSGRCWRALSMCTVRARVMFNRKAYAWRTAFEIPSSSVDSSTSTRLYVTCWDEQVFLLQRAPQLLVFGQLLPRTNLHSGIMARQRSFLNITVLLDAMISGKHKHHGVDILLTLMQQIAAHIKTKRVLLLTKGWLSLGSLRGSSRAAHGAAWGYGRVLRLEHPVLHVQNVDILQSVAISAPGLLVSQRPESLNEPEMVVQHNTTWCIRMRSCASGSRGYLPLGGRHVITGGLGGLGLRSAKMLVEACDTEIVLSSRSGNIVSKLNYKGIASVTASDSCDAHDTQLLFAPGGLTGVLHGSGVLRDRSFRSVAVADTHSVFAPKAVGAENIHLTVATRPLEAFGLFSSAAAAFGNSGQASYAAANSHLDALASGRWASGSHGSSLQIPAVLDVGMSAGIFVEQQLRAMGAVTIDEFTSRMCLLLSPTHAITERAQVLMSPTLEALMNARENGQRFLNGENSSDVSGSGHPVCHEESLLIDHETTLPRGSGQYIRLRVAKNTTQLELNDPTHFNSLSVEMASDMRAAVQWLKGSENVGSVVLSGAGNHFCPGGNMYRQRGSVDLYRIKGAAISRSV